MTPNSRRIFDQLRAARVAALAAGTSASSATDAPNDSADSGPPQASTLETRPRVARRRTTTGTLARLPRSSSAPFAFDELITRRYAAPTTKIGRVQFARASWPPPQAHRAHAGGDRALSSVLRSLEDAAGPRSSGRRRTGERFVLPLPVPDEPVAPTPLFEGPGLTTVWPARHDEAPVAAPLAGAPHVDPGPLLDGPALPLPAATLLPPAPSYFAAWHAPKHGPRGARLVLAIAVIAVALVAVSWWVASQLTTP